MYDIQHYFICRPSDSTRLDLVHILQVSLAKYCMELGALGEP